MTQDYTDYSGFLFSCYYHSVEAFTDIYLSIIANACKNQYYWVVKIQICELKHNCLLAHRKFLPNTAPHYLRPLVFHLQSTHNME